ncbi:hypothetical protein [Streptomyces sioyaensis]|uniref:Uncharacterized protein n=1 Tax=Streptomyces sioyaensis TaxID=67364 RepID=A0A4Q1QUM2_9ACTN|nr:hypothetical protein [Streptomyces sioyaensis]RXS60039.1 hypothetical protein EST54_28330 [Streptomyces sioyaensis]
MGWRDVTARGRAGRHPRAVPGRWISAAALGGVWWWAAARLVLWPQSAGVVEGAVVVGGWGLSLLPVHCVPWTDRGDGICRRVLARAVRGVLEFRGFRGADRAAVVRAWRRRRSGGGSGRS